MTALQKERKAAIGNSLTFWLQFHPLKLLHSTFKYVYLLIKVLETLLPVGSPSNIATLIQQFDAVEVQHEGIGRQESPLCFPGALEFLVEFRTTDQEETDR